MLEIDIPGRGTFGIRHVVCDYNGTIAVDGHLIEGVASRIREITEFAQVKGTVTQSFLDLAGMALENNSPDLLTLRQRLAEVTARQGELLDQVLEHMEDQALNAQLKAVMEEKQDLQEQIRRQEQDAVHSQIQSARMAELRAWVERLEINTEYSDEQVRMAIEKITVVDAETIRVQFRYPGLEVEKKLCGQKEEQSDESKIFAGAVQQHERPGGRCVL